MKTKMLSLLIATPLVAFAVSAAIPGGDKDKTKQEATSASAQPQQEAPLQQPADPSASIQAITPTADTEMSAADLAKEMEVGMAYMEEQKNKLFEDIEEWQWDLPESTEDLLEQKMMVPVRKAMNYNVDDEMFSRCPSGLSTRVYTISEDKDSGEGFLTRARGCRVLPISRFRYDVSEKSLSLWVSDKAGYVSVDKWVKAYKAYEKTQEQEANG